MFWKRKEKESTPMTELDVSFKTNRMKERDTVKVELEDSSIFLLALKVLPEKEKPYDFDVSFAVLSKYFTPIQVQSMLKDLVRAIIKM